MDPQALHLAAKSNNLKRVKLLIEQGADIDNCNRGGMTPLLWASQNGHINVVRYLVEQKADKNWAHDGNNCCTPLFLASWKGHFEVALYLVEQVAALDKANNWGVTPLITAAANGRLEICRYLLEQGADRDKADKRGQTALHRTAYNGYLEIAMLLMSYGADLNARDKDGKLPIYLTRSEEIKQAIRDEPRRRMDEAPGKRATEEDRHPNVATSASAQQEEGEQEEEEQSNKRPRLNDEGVTVAGKVAEEDEDSEPSSDEDDA